MQLFHDKLSIAIEKNIEEKTIELFHKKIIKEPWITKGIIQSNKKQLTLYRDWLRNKIASKYDRYKQYRITL